MVGGEVRLALRAVEQEIVDLLILGRRELDVRREGRAAHADDAGIGQNAHDVLRSVGGDVAVGRHAAFVPLILKVVFNDDAVDGVAAGDETRLDGNDLAGDRCVHGCGHIALDLAHLLTALDLIAHADAGRAGRADVLRHGNIDTFGGGHDLNGLLRAQTLAVTDGVQRMNAAAEGFHHIHTDIRPLSESRNDTRDALYTHGIF